MISRRSSECLVRVQSDDGHHARWLRIRCRLHAFSPQLHQLQTILEAAIQAAFSDRNLYTRSLSSNFMLKLMCANMR